MVQIIEKTTPYGKLAENFGRNLGESMSSEFSKQNTSSGISNLANQLSKEGVTDRLQLYTKLRSIPGMTDQELQRVLPLFESSLRERDIENLDKNGSQLDRQRTSTPSNRVESTSTGVQAIDNQTTRQPNSPVAAPVAAPPDDRVNRSGIRTSLVSQEDQKALTDKEFIPNERDILIGANQLRKTTGNLYPTINEAAQAYLKDVEAQNKQLQQRQKIAGTKEALTQKVRDDTNSRILSKLQSPSLQDAWRELPGTLQDTLINKSIDKVYNGKTTAQAAEEVAREALNTVKSINDFKSYSNASWFSRGSEKTLKELSNYRKTFEDQDALDEYRSMLIEKGYGEHVASSLAYPMGTNVKKQLAQLEKRSLYSGLQKIMPESAARQANIKMNEASAQQYAQSLAQSMSPLDSVESISLAFNDLGFDEGMFFNALDRLVESEEISLTVEQQRELDRRLPVNPSLTDLIASASFGKKTGKYGFFQSLLRKTTGKR